MNKDSYSYFGESYLDELNPYISFIRKGKVSSIEKDKPAHDPLHPFTSRSLCPEFRDNNGVCSKEDSCPLSHRMDLIKRTDPKSFIDADCA